MVPKNIYTIVVRVSIGSSTKKIKEEDLANGSKILRVYVTAAPEQGKANQEVIRVLSKHLELPKSAIKIIKGLKSRDKIIQISN
jgi:uncharacterized protein